MDDSVGTSLGDPVSDSEFATVLPCFGEGCFDDGSGMDDSVRTFSVTFWTLSVHLMLHVQLMMRQPKMMLKLQQLRQCWFLMQLLDYWGH
jgi:hypothetical protein